VIYNLTYTSPELNQQINQLVGNPYGLFSKIRWQGIGSERLIVTDALGYLRDLFQGRFVQNFASIEQRPGGIIIRIRHGLEVYGVVIPYGKLTIYKNNPEALNIHFDGQKLTLRHYHERRVKPVFISALLKAKAAYFNEYHAN